MFVRSTCFDHYSVVSSTTGLRSIQHGQQRREVVKSTSSLTLLRLITYLDCSMGKVDSKKCRLQQRPDLQRLGEDR